MRHDLPGLGRRGVFVAVALVCAFAVACTSSPAKQPAEDLTGGPSLDTAPPPDVPVSPPTPEVVAAEDTTPDVPDEPAEDVLLADAGPDPTQDVPGVDVPDEPPPIELPDGLNGVAAAEHLPAPDFMAVVDSSGRAVAPSELRGRPTILWFYPMAGTSG